MHNEKVAHIHIMYEARKKRQAFRNRRIICISNNVTLSSASQGNICFKLHIRYISLKSYEKLGSKIYIIFDKCEQRELGEPI
jgi:hypothetical protein